MRCEASDPVGAVLIAAGLVPLVSAFVEFVKARGATPVPVASSERLVVSGFNRYVRNPTYDGLLLAIIGQALLFSNIRVLAYAAARWAANAWFVGWYEEPAMAGHFGADYEAYRRAVPAWLPRLHPWPLTRQTDYGLSATDFPAGLTVNWVLGGADEMCTTPSLVLYGPVPYRYRRSSPHEADRR